jgi:hypothetical protein
MIIMWEPCHYLRKKGGLSGLLATTLLVCASTAHPEIPDRRSQAGYTKLVFKDNFDRLDISRDGGGRHRWYNGLWYRDPATVGAFKVRKGILTATTDIHPLNTTRMSFLTTWAHKPSGKSRLFRYGYFEARLRFKPGEHNWPAFWLESASRTSFDQDAGDLEWCELDIFEGGWNGRFQGTVHHWKDNKSSSNDNQHTKLGFGVDQSQWNTYGMLWEPGIITWYFNDEPIIVAASPPICDQSDMFLIIGTQKRKGGTKPESIDVDWVHVFQKP